MDDVLIALHQSARRRKGGISGLARELGRQEKTLLSKLNPDDDAHQPTMGEFVALLHRFERREVQEVLGRMVSMFGYELATRTKGAAPSVLQAVLHAVAEHADIVREVEASIADGEISGVERGRILRECSEARRAIVHLENTLIGGAA